MKNEDLRPYLISFALSEGLYSYQLDRITKTVDDFLKRKKEIEKSIIDKMFKTCPECGAIYSEDLCPFCESEKHWKEIYSLVKDFETIINLHNEKIY